MNASPVRRAVIAVLTVTSLLAALFPTVGAQAVSPPAPPVMSGPVVSPAVHQDVSVPLREILENHQDQAGDHQDHEAKRIRPPHSVTSPSSGAASSTTTAAAPAVGLQFDGVGNGFSGPAGTFTVNSAPPDTNLAVGPNHVVEIVNSNFAIFNKSGTAIYGPVAINTVWSGFGGGCQANNDGDPIAKYDPIADRWLISQFSVTTTPYLQCVAVSQSADPAGAYNRYSFQYANFPDYPKLSVWPDAYYITFNMFAGGTTFSGGTACAYDRAKMLAGLAATQQCFNLGTTYGGLLSSDLDGSRLPPAGSPAYVVSDGASGTDLVYWKFHTDWATPANTTLTGPTTLASAAFTQPCGGTGATCVPQTGTTQQLDTLGDRFMYRLAYRNFGDHEALVVNHSVSAGSSVGIRWFELRPSGSNLSIFQQGTYAPDSDYRWMGSIAQDQSGDIGLGFSISASSRHPGIHYTGRLPGDALGTMAQGEGTVVDGAGSQTANLSRWGDYSALAIDPVDGCTFWYGNEYIPANGTFNWRTRIATFRFPGCGGTTPPNDFSISASPSSVTVAQGATGTSTVSTGTTSGSAQTVALSASGLPSGATAAFAPTSVSSGGSSTVTLTTSTSTPAGSYSVTVTGTGTSTTHTTSVSLTVSSSGGGGGGITNGGFETGTYAGWTTSGTAAVATTPHSGSFAAQVGGTSPTNGDSTISQTFTAPSATGPLTFWYQIHCPDTITYDWASATLKDNTSNTSSTLLANTCGNTGAWQQSSPASITGGHSYTLTLLSHDDNYSTDPTYTLFDDVALAAPPAPDFAISATPGSQTVPQTGMTSYTVTVTPTNGFTGSVILAVSGFGAGATGSFNPTSIAGSGNSTLTVNTSAATPGTYPLTITGTSGSTTHSTSVSLVVTAPPPPSDFSIAVNPGSQTVTQGNSTTYTVSTAITSGSAQTVALSASGLPAGATASFSPSSVNSGASSTVTVSTSASTPAGSYTFTITGTGTIATHSTSAGLVVNLPSATVIVNGGFETGNLSGWTATGATAISTTARTGTYAAQVGSASPFNGDSKIAQTFTAPAGTGHTLSFWYRVVCTDSVTYDWATATLKDNTTNVTTTVLAKTCTNSGTYVQKSAALTGGHSYTLSLIDHDDNWASPADPTYTLYDDVSVS